MARVRSTPPRRRKGDARLGVLWHLAWAAAIAAVAGALAWRGLLGPGPELFALAIGMAAALFGALFSTLGGPGRTIAVVLWALAGAAACQLTGGPGGPLAAWTLAPAAAACAFRRRELLSLGAAAAVAAAGLSALNAALLPLPQATPELSPWLAVLALATVALGTGAGLIGFEGAFRREARRRDAAELELLELIDHQPQLLMVVGPDGRIVRAAGAPLAGGPARQQQGRHLANLAAEADRPAVEAALQAADEDGSAELYLAPVHDPEGWLELTIVRLSGGRYAAAIRNARAQRARERRLEDARAAAEQQNAGKSRFLANMSHELRTPLNAIMGFSDIMRQRLFGPMGDRYAEYADLIHESGSHLLELINDVLDMSKIEAERFELHIESFDARDAVHAVLRLMRGQADRAGVNLRGVMPRGPLPADADRRAVKQIALNLISNALKFTPRGGSVTVTLQGAGDILELIVADTGVGIAQNDLERLGRPFEQAGQAENKAAGTGLGLSLVRAFARLHGGEMSVESAVGEGTSVTVRMPVLSSELDRDFHTARTHETLPSQTV